MAGITVMQVGLDAIDAQSETPIQETESNVPTTENPASDTETSGVSDTQDTVQTDTDSNPLTPAPEETGAEQTDTDASGGKESDLTDQTNPEEPLPEESVEEIPDATAETLLQIQETLVHIDSVLQYNASILIVILVIVLLNYVYRFFKMFF